jgi:hypothetical protein
MKTKLTPEQALVQMLHWMAKEQRPILQVLVTHKPFIEAVASVSGHFVDKDATPVISELVLTPAEDKLLEYMKEMLDLHQTVGNLTTNLRRTREDAEAMQAKLDAIDGIINNQPKENQQ